MPEGYTHLRCAWRAVRAQKLTADLHREAFFAGANGPDMLFCYQVWKPARKRAHPLPDLGERMHNENTGAFLRALIEGAKTPVQRSYAAGFLCHYGADTVVHPYVVLATSPGQAYEGPGGHGYFEIALDSQLHERDTGDAAVPVAHCCPRMDDAALDEVIPLLAGAIEAAYGERYPEQALRDAFVQATFIRSLFVCRGPVKRGLLVFCCGFLCTGATLGMYLLGFAGKDIIIYFGVLQCLGCCMMLWPLFRRANSALLTIVALAMIVLGLWLRTVGFSFPWLTVLGFAPYGFASSDYFPLFPNLGYFLLGAVLGRALYAEKKSLLPRENPPAKALQWMGRESLLIYLLHQPILAAVVGAIAMIK